MYNFKRDDTTIPFIDAKTCFFCKFFTSSYHITFFALLSCSACAFPGSPVLFGNLLSVIRGARKIKLEKICRHHQLVDFLKPVLQKLIHARTLVGKLDRLREKQTQNANCARTQTHIDNQPWLVTAGAIASMVD